MEGEGEREMEREGGRKAERDGQGEGRVRIEGGEEKERGRMKARAGGEPKACCQMSCCMIAKSKPLIQALSLPQCIGIFR